MANTHFKPLDDPPGTSSSDDNESQTQEEEEEENDHTIFSSEDDEPIPEEDHVSVEAQPPSPSVKSKRRIEDTSPAVNTKRTKREDKKTQYVRRIWSEEDEIAILKGIIAFVADTKKSPFEDVHGFYEFVKESICSNKASFRQYIDKVRHLKRKFMKQTKKNGSEPVSFANANDQKCFELSKLIWGDEGIDSGIERSKKKKEEKLESLKQDLLLSSPDGKDDDDVGGDVVELQSFRRIWSEEDEIAILKGIIAFVADTGKSPFEDCHGFYEFVKDSVCSNKASFRQYTDKVRHLKRKYTKQSKKTNGSEPISFANANDQKCFELSKLIWGDEGIDSGTERSKEEEKLESVKQDLMFSSPNGKEVVEKDDDVVELQNFRRIWSEEDEIAMLKGIIAFVADTGKSPSEDFHGFYEFVKESLCSNKASFRQYTDKVRHLKRKFIKQTKRNGSEPISFVNANDQKCFELSKFIWGDEGIDSVKKTERSKKKEEKKFESLKQDLLFSSPNGEDDDDVGGGVELPTSVKTKPDWFEKSFLVRAIAVLGVDEAYVKERWNKVPVETRKELEEKWKLCMAKEFECVLQKTDVMRQVASAIAEPS